MLPKSPIDSARASDCVGDFKECAPTLGKCKYNYAKASDSVIRSALRSALGEPVIRRNVMRYEGFSLKKDGPVVGMEKARVENPEFRTLQMAPTSITAYPCFCAAVDLSKWLQGRPHYRCGGKRLPHSSQIGKLDCESTVLQETVRNPTQIPVSDQQTERGGGIWAFPATNVTCATDLSSDPVA